MSAKTFALALAAVGLAAVLPAQASAYNHGGFGGDIGFGYEATYEAEDYSDIGYGGISCWKGKNIVRWQGFKNIQAYDCSAPVYKYKAWKNGEAYRVKVNWQGYIMGIKPF